MERIGVVGLGTMGGAMAANLVRAGFPVRAWNRTAGRAGGLEALGVTIAASPAAVAADVVVVLVCVSDTPDVEAVLFGTGGVAEGAHPGSLVIDCSTISPEATRQFGNQLAARGVAMVDAPVSGGSEGAELGNLTIFVGGEDSDVARARPILEKIGKTITHMGPLGSGQSAKAVNQVIICGVYLGVVEGLILGMRAGLDLQLLVEALSRGAAQSWVLDNRSGHIIDDEYPLGFRLALHRKDLAIALEMARSGAPLWLDRPSGAHLEDDLMAAGHGDEDMSILARAVRGGA